MSVSAASTHIPDLVHFRNAVRTLITKLPSHSEIVKKLNEVVHLGNSEWISLGRLHPVMEDSKTSTHSWKEYLVDAVSAAQADPTNPSRHDKVLHIVKGCEVIPTSVFSPAKRQVADDRAFSTFELALAAHSYGEFHKLFAKLPDDNDLERCGPGVRQSILDTCSRIRKITLEQWELTPQLSYSSATSGGSSSLTLGESLHQKLSIALSTNPTNLHGQMAWGLVNMALEELEAFGYYQDFRKQAEALPVSESGIAGCLKHSLLLLSLHDYMVLCRLDGSVATARRKLLKEVKDLEELTLALEEHELSEDEEQEAHQQIDAIVEAICSLCSTALGARWHKIWNNNSFPLPLKLDSFPPGRS